MIEKYNYFRCGTMYIETNADKGFVADELEKYGVYTETYHEKMNKHVKIVTYLKTAFQGIVWSGNSDDVYLEQIVDYIEGQEPDDAPDSSASLVCHGFHSISVNNALWEW